MGRLLSLVIVMFSPRNCASHRLPRVCCVPLSDLVSAVWDDAGTLGRAAVEVSEVGATVVSLTGEGVGNDVGVGDGVGDGVGSLGSSSEFRLDAFALAMRARRGGALNGASDSSPRKDGSIMTGFIRGSSDADTPPGNSTLAWAFSTDALSTFRSVSIPSLPVFLPEEIFWKRALRSIRGFLLGYRPRTAS